MMPADSDSTPMADAEVLDGVRAGRLVRFALAGATPARPDVVAALRTLAEQTPNATRRPAQLVEQASAAERAALVAATAQTIIAWIRHGDAPSIQAARLIAAALEESGR